MPRKYKAGTVALREIKQYQKTYGALLPYAPMRRLVQEILQQHGRYRLRKETIMALRAAAEKYLINNFEEGQDAAIHAGRVTLKPEDIRLVKEIRDEKMDIGCCLPTPCCFPTPKAKPAISTPRSPEVFAIPPRIDEEQEYWSRDSVPGEGSVNVIPLTETEIIEIKTVIEQLTLADLGSIMPAGVEAVVRNNRNYTPPTARQFLGHENLYGPFGDSIVGKLFRMEAHKYRSHHGFQAINLNQFNYGSLHFILSNIISLYTPYDVRMSSAKLLLPYDEVVEIPSP